MINSKNETQKVCDQIDEQYGALSVEARLKMIEWMIEGFINEDKKNAE